MAFADIAVGIGLTLGAGAAIYGTSTQAGIANRGLSMAQITQGEQMQAFQQLQQLLTNPGSFFDNPVYKAAFDQGTSAVAKSNAAQFGPNSFNEATALQTFGQSFGQQQLLSQEQLLASMSGTQAASSPSQFINSASGAATSAQGSLNSLAGLLAFFGSSGGGGGGGGVDYSQVGDVVSKGLG